MKIFQIGATAMALGLCANLSGAQTTPSQVARAEGLSSAQWARLELGDGIVAIRAAGPDSGTTAALVQGYVLAQVPWERAFIVVADHESYPAWFRACMRGIDVVSRDTERGLARMRVRERHRSYGLSSEYTLTYVHDPEQRTITWVLDTTVKHDTFAQYAGAWRLVPLGDTATLIVHEFRAQPKGWIPGRIQRWFLERGIPEFMRALKQRTETPPDLAAR